ncbi:Dolichyl-phosphate-mannose-protein mannosyltransferase-domain-containing protein [Cokeromyces recurvatus]|uniref:Dolichyl-phosphate-mannose-protein mannosyltransferase-domain-containing protein n=1 Tax=Cokeromyces recurvatus TaxID=90255 RepID=UPI00221EB272|nr:Dolichyl-phosphate-mannose-protein mannosyltransferase-domain-containing protein [Cokeromyces recurvatus]KAI7904603.1 Dolichyl-phosphate-mannose-protein mannosyltransferase-domain-containing protein [Cokeromyces recurvatus]
MVIPNPLPERMDSLYYKHLNRESSPPPQDHVPVSIENSAFTTSLTPADNFRKRNNNMTRNNDYDFYEDSSDADLLIKSKSYKLQQRKEAMRKQSRKRDWYIALGLTLWAAYIRLYKIYQPPSVVFDEVHFGGFATKYIKTRFFMDVHPPLAKMMIALVGKLAGLTNFDFKEIGKDYLEEHVPYVIMRTFCGIMGLLVVPIAYLTIRGAGHSIAAGLVAAFMVCYENGLITNNRLILLDPPLLFFTAATTLVWINFHNQKRKPFQFWWYFGLTVSCKWVGLFTIATIGASTIKGLWEIWGNTRIPLHAFIRHFSARAVALIVVPIFIYMLMFQIHFHSLPNSGEGDGFMSPEFQQTLDGYADINTPIDIAYGSKVYIRHVATKGGYLHSHSHNYPAGSKQQQVTLYPHRDDNNWWTILKVNDVEPTGIEYIKDGDIITLKHLNSDKRLHSHEIRPPMTDLEYHNEVSCYGFDNFTGDSNDQWRVHIISGEKSDPESTKRLRTIHTKFALVHVMTHCSLFSHPVKLPEWGFGQQEVTCIKDGKVEKTVWYVESTENPLLPEDTEKVSYKKLGFLSKFIELNKVMWETNKGLTSSHPYDSRPESWPLLRRGINYWSKDKLHLYLLGNPLVYWTSTISILVCIILKAAFVILDKRGIKKDFGELRKFYDESAGFFLVGWAFHYFPFFLMGRQLFLHHYMPALYFAILLFSVGFDMLTVRLVNRKRLMAAGLFIISIIYVYRFFIPITYGEPWTQSLCEKAKWRSTWDFDCAQ